MRSAARGGGGTGGASVALGRSLAWPILRVILGTFAIGGLLVGSGVILLASPASAAPARAAHELTLDPEPGSVTLTDLRGNE
jgi:hypothetical protein